MRRFLLFELLFLLACWCFAHFVSNEYFFYACYAILQYIVLATAWNILAGYCGYMNFGTAAFFGLGTYTAVAMIKWIAAPLWLQTLSAALVAGLLGFAVGAMTMRLRGIYFSIGTFAVSIIAEIAVQRWGFVGGAAGITLVRPEVASGFKTYNRFLFFWTAILVVLAVAAAKFIQTSWVGRGMHAVRDDEEAAEGSGVPTFQLKVFAATVSGALMGAVGAPQAQFLSFVEPSLVFNLNYAIMALAMAVIGGMTHWLGPVIGALVLGTLLQVAAVTLSSDLNVFIVGATLIAFVVIAPGGLMGLSLRRKLADAC